MDLGHFLLSTVFSDNAEEILKFIGALGLLGKVINTFAVNIGGNRKISQKLTELVRLVPDSHKIVEIGFQGIDSIFLLGDIVEGTSVSPRLAIDLHRELADLNS